MNQTVIWMESVSDFSIHLEKQGRSASTILVYTRSIHLFFSLFPVLSAENLLLYRHWLLKHYKPSTVNARILGINRYLSFLWEIPGYFTLFSSESETDEKSSASVMPLCSSFNGCWHLPPVRTQVHTYLDTVISQKDYDRLKRLLKKDQNYFWYFIVRFLAATGARVSELRQIKMEDLQLGYLDLYSKGGKIRRLFFPRTLCEEAIPYFASRGIESGFLFLTNRHTLISARAIEMQLKKIAQRYRIDPATMYPHSFRHRYAINFLKRFNDISLLADLLGHDSIETTRIYLMKSSQEQRTVIDRVVTW